LMDKEIRASKQYRDATSHRKDLHNLEAFLSSVRARRFL
jgi:hypothetical protein